MSVAARITALKTDITTLAVDAIVNAANVTLMGGGGVDGAIHRAAGPGLRAECATLGGCATGDAKITGGHRLAARYVIHTVGPVWHGGGAGEADLLASCYRRCYEIAATHAITTIAFPAISCGAFGYPLSTAVAIAVREARLAIARYQGFAEVLFACFGDDALDAYRHALAHQA